MKNLSLYLEVGSTTASLSFKIFLSKLKAFITKEGFDMGSRSIRDGFGEALLELGAKQSNIVAVSADLQESVRMQKFGQQFPDRFFEVGVAEQNMIGVAAGLAKEGFIAFTGSFAAFSPGRTFDQIRTSVALSHRNVKVVGGHAGLTVGEDGATHQMLEDLAMMRALPNTTVLIPSDFTSAKQLTYHAVQTPGCVYLRLSRLSVPDLITGPFKPDEPTLLRSGDTITLVTSGVMGERVLGLAEWLKEQVGVSAKVVALHQLKPLNTNAWIECFRESKAVVSVEEHQVHGGVGSALAELLSEHIPRPLLILGVEDRFGKSGAAEELLDAYGFTAPLMGQRVWEFLKRHQVL